MTNTYCQLRAETARSVKRFCLLLLLIAFTATAGNAQDISGDWQGTVAVGPQVQLRILLHVGKSDNGDWNASFQLVDQIVDWGVGVPMTPFSFDGSKIRGVVDRIQGGYEGTLSDDGSSMTGTWTMLGVPRPLAFRRPAEGSDWRDPSPHQVQFLEAARDVNLEVLDWGGSGRPLVFLAGAGNTAHIFDNFAPKFTSKFHVYGITRRGFGASSAPAPTKENYTAERLGDDVLAILDALKLEQPILVGHSLGGEEMSSIGSRYPERVAGLVYLDAAYAPYAFYDASLEAPPFTGDAPLIQALSAGIQHFTEIPDIPILAIYAVPRESGLPEGDARTAADAENEAATEAQIAAFERLVPSARIVRLRHANHHVFLSNEGDVLREMNAFFEDLPGSAAAAPAPAQQTTTWSGTLNAGPAKLRLQVDITQTGGDLAGRLVSLDQGNATLDLAGITQSDTRLSFTVPQLRASFEGQMNSDATAAEGEFSQAGMTFPLTLRRQDRNQAAAVETLREAWVGTLKLGEVEAVLQFRIMDTETGGMLAYFDSISENLRGFGGTWSLEDNTLAFQIPAIGLSFRGTLNATGDIAEGTWSQGGMQLPLTLKKQATEYSEQ